MPVVFVVILRLTCLSALALQFQLTINGVAIVTAVGGALALQVRRAAGCCCYQ
jgi:hypothetical protein